MSDDVRPEQIYEALFDDEAFADLPQHLARAGGGRSAVMQWSHADGDTRALAYSYFSPDYVAAYADGFVDYDPWLAAAVRPENLNRTVNGSSHISPESFERSVLFNEYSRAHGDDTFCSIGSALTSSDGAGLISVSRGRRQQPFEQDDVARLDRVIRPARHVLRVRGVLASARRQAVMQRGQSESVGLCLMTVRRDGYVLDLNMAADRVLQEASIFRLVNGCLLAVRPQDCDALAAALAGATRCDRPIGTTFPLEIAGRGRRIGVAVTPLSASGTSAALLTFRVQESRSDIALQLRQVYGLTRMEAELAVSLSHGRTQREHAAARGVLESTVRSQLKSLTAKMGCRRQAEVVALIARLPPAPANC